MSNCGLPDGVIHQHVERCYQAGLQEGADAFRMANQGSINDLIDFAALAVKALRAIDEYSGGWPGCYRALTPEEQDKLENYVISYGTTSDA